MLVHRLLRLLLAISPLLHFSSLGIFSDAKLSVDRVKECMDSILDGKNYRRKVADPMFVLHFGDAATETFNVLSPHEMKSVEALAKCTQEEDSSLFDRYPHTYFTGSNVTFISGLFQSLLPGIHEKVLQAVALGLDDAEWLLPAAVAAAAATITPTKSTSFPTNTDAGDGGSRTRARAKRQQKTRAEDVHAAFGIRTVQYLSFQKEGLAKYKAAIQEARNIQRPALIIYPNEEEAEEANRDEVTGFHFQKTGKRDRGSGGSDLFADFFDPNADDAIADFLHYYGPLWCEDGGEDEEKEEEGRKGEKEEFEMGGEKREKKGGGAGENDESLKAAAGGSGEASARKGTVYAVFIVLSDREEFLHGELLVHKDAHCSSDGSGNMPGNSAAGASASSSPGLAFSEDPYDDEGLEEVSLLAEKKRLKDADRKTQVQHQDRDREGAHAGEEGILSSISATGGGEGEKFQRFHALHSRVSRFTPERGSVVLIDAAHELGMQQVMFGSFRALYLELWSYDDAPVGVRKVSASEAQPLSVSRSRSAAGKNSVKSEL